MGSNSIPTVWWTRRDLRLHDNPALRAAIDSGSSVLALFVLDPRLLARAKDVRTRWLMASLRALDADLREGGGPGLSVVEGVPEEKVPQLARAVGARQVHISADFGPYGRRRDDRVRAALAEHGIELVATGSPYAVAPGRLSNKSGGNFQVFTPFHRAWADVGVHAPADGVRVSSVDWQQAAGRKSLDRGDAGETTAASESTARKAWKDWLDRDSEGADDYADLNNFPAADATSHLSVPLRWGQLHPRTLLADLAPKRSKGAAALSRQLAWRDFFADVLFHKPDAVTSPIRPEFAKMPTESPESDPETARRLEAWQQGRTGFPMVDAGMRQLLTEGWMHNRVRMITASFLIKDLHIGWWHGADWFMAKLRDGDIAQNQLNWQWVAGCGTDAAPYFRVFNPSSQAEKFDKDGGYIRRYVPELADLELAFLHEPWKNPAGLPAGYPGPIVDHAEERIEALERYQLIKK